VEYSLPGSSVVEQARIANLKPVVTRAVLTVQSEVVQ